MNKIKNMTFPICARRREASDERLILTESIANLREMKSFSKEDQYLFFYNSQNKKFIQTHCGRKIPHCVKSDKRSPQTTLVIDFDNIVQSVQNGIRESFEEFHRTLRGRALLLNSPSGNIHVLYVVRGAMPQEDYRRLQESVIRRFFSKFEMFIDKPCSYSVNRGFYHSQHLSRWIESGLVNPTPALQKKKGFFWSTDFELKFSDFYRLLSAGNPIEDRKIHELAEDGLRVLEYMRILARSGTDEEKQEYSKEIERILACLRRKEEGRTKSRAEEICRRSQEEEYQAAVRCIESFSGKTVFRAEGVQDFRREVVCRNGSEPALKDQCGYAENPAKAGESRVFGSNPESRGHCSGSASGNEGADAGGYRADISNERILDAVSSIRDAFEARNFPYEKLGRIVLKNILRSNSHGNDVSKESDLELFFTILREAVDEHPGLRGHLESSPERLFVWLRHAGRYLRAHGESSKSLSVFAADSARCLRLYLKTQSIPITLSGHEFQRRLEVPEEAAQRFIDAITPNLEKLMRGLSKQNIVSGRKIFREDHEFLRKGTAAFLTRMKQLFPLIKTGRQVGIGIEDFQEFFQTHVRKAGLLRHVFMGFISFGGAEYIPCVRRRQFLIKPDAFSSILGNSEITPTSAEELSSKIGNGRTWEAMCRYTKPMVETLGVYHTKRVWYDALDMSNANEAERRKKDIDKFVEAIITDKAR